MTAMEFVNSELPTAIWRFTRGDLRVTDFIKILGTMPTAEQYLGTDLYMDATTNDYKNERMTWKLIERLRSFVEQGTGRPFAMLILGTEPTENKYYCLLDYLLGNCSRLGLVVRNSLKLNESAHIILDRLYRNLLHTEHTNIWPGTILIESKAVVCTYEFNTATLAVLKSESDRLFGWRSPDRPEDPFFYSESGDFMLGSICHEKGAFVEGTNKAIEKIQGFLLQNGLECSLYQ